MYVRIVYIYNVLFFSSFLFFLSYPVSEGTPYRKRCTMCAVLSNRKRCFCGNWYICRIEMDWWARNCISFRVFAVSFLFSKKLSECTKESSMGILTPRNKFVLKLLIHKFERFECSFSPIHLWSLLADQSGISEIDILLRIKIYVDIDVDLDLSI